MAKTEVAKVPACGTPITNPHIWEITGSLPGEDDPIWKTVEHNGKMKSVRFQLGVCKKCGAERLFVDLLLVDKYQPHDNAPKQDKVELPPDVADALEELVDPEEM